MNNNVIGNIFHTKTKRGVSSFQSVEKVLTIKGLFPRLNTDSCFKLFGHCDFGKYDATNIVRLSDLENKGYKVSSELKNFGLELNEQSDYFGKDNKDIFLDISATTLPRKLSRGNMLNRFNFDDKFIDDIIKSYERNSGFKLRGVNESNFSLDFNNKTIFFPKHSDKVKQLGSIIKAVSACKIIGNQDVYDRVLKDEKLKNIIKSNLVLVNNAISDGYKIKISDDSFRNIYKGVDTAKFKKDYVWGKNDEDAFNRIDSLCSVIEDVIKGCELESNFYNHLFEQDNLKIESVINTTKKAGYNSSLVISDDEIKELNKRSLDELRSLNPVDSGLLDDLGVEYRKSSRGFSFRSFSKGSGAVDNSANIYESGGKWIYKDFSSGSGGTIENLVMDKLSCDFKSAVNYCYDNTNIPNYFEDRKKEIDYMKKNSTTKVNSRQILFSNIIDKYKDSISLDDKKKLTRMTIDELKRFEIDKKDEEELNKEYSIIENKSFSSSSANSKVINSEDIENNLDAFKYLKEVRKFNRFPNELKLITGVSFKDGVNKVSKVVGFVNEVNGCDGKHFKGFREGNPQSYGSKGLTLLNEFNLSDKKSNFIVVESQWDLVAFYNDDRCKEIYDNSVIVILNGTTMANKAINYINENKQRYSSLTILGQGDDANLNAMRMLSNRTSLSKINKFLLEDSDIEAKKDVNDLLRDGVDLYSRMIGEGINEIKVKSDVNAREVGM